MLRIYAEALDRLRVRLNMYLIIIRAYWRSNPIIQWDINDTFALIILLC